MKAEINIHSHNEIDALSPASVTELTDWLTSTAALQVPELEEKVKQFLYVDCSDHERLELLDWIRPLLSNTAHAVRTAFADGKLPLPDHVINHVDGLARIYAVMADLYKTTITSIATLVLDNSEEYQNNQKELHEDLILACYGAISCLSDQLRATYEGYRPAPKGIWYEIHHIYNYSRYIIDLSRNSSGVLDDAIRDEFYLIEHAYKRSLLLGLCNPYHFSVAAFNVLNWTLNRWANLATIEHDVQAARQTCMFSVDAQSDYPAVPVLSHSGDVITSERYSVLSTKVLVATLKRQVEAMAKEAFENPVKNASSRFLLRIEMFRRMAMNWGKHPVRQDTRHEKDGTCESVAGYSKIIENMSAMLFTALKKTPLDENRCCQVTDASEMGCQIEMSPGSTTRFQVGDMIAVRDDSRIDEWSLAVVRWARYTNEERIKVGMFIMGRQAERFKLQADLSSDEVIDVMSVVGTSNFPVEKKILLVPIGTYRPGRMMELIGAESHRIVAGNLVMSGADFDVIDYKVIS